MRNFLGPPILHSLRWPIFFVTKSPFLYRPSSRILHCRKVLSHFLLISVRLAHYEGSRLFFSTRPLILLFAGCFSTIPFVFAGFDIRLSFLGLTHLGLMRWPPFLPFSRIFLRSPALLRFLYSATPFLNSTLVCTSL